MCWRRVADSGQPEMLNGLSAEGACAHLLRALGCRSHIVVPLVARQRTLGLLSLIRGQGPYVDEDLQLAVRLAELAALAIDNARLYEEAREALRVRDQFLSVAVHELRVPMTSLRGLSALILQSGTGRADPALEGRLRTIVRQVDRLAALVAGGCPDQPARERAAPHAVRHEGGGQPQRVRRPSPSLRP